MNPPRIAAVTIGQTPRPDLLEPLLAHARAEEVAEFGALDGLARDRMPVRGGAGDGAYPLTTRLRDGARVTLDEAELAPLVQQAVRRAEDAGAQVILLLCAGGFLGVGARPTLVRPFDAAVARLRAVRARRLFVVVPFEEQAAPSRQKWTAAGFEPAMLLGDPATVVVPADGSADAIVLDYVGHPSRDVETLRARTAVPVIDLGEVGAAAAMEAVASPPADVAASSR